MKIFVIEDDPAIQTQLKILLRNALYEVVTVRDFSCAAKEALDAQPDLILLDICLPQEDGYEICRQIRAVTEIPVIFLTSKTDASDELNGMLTGADDYVTKPFVPAVLLARIAAVLKRSQPPKMPELSEELPKVHGVWLDLKRGCICHGDLQADLTKNEMKILYYLFQNAGTIVSRMDLLDELWDAGVFIDDNALSVNVTRIRGKLKSIGAADLIETKRGMGYRIG